MVVVVASFFFTLIDRYVVYRVKYIVCVYECLQNRLKNPKITNKITVSVYLKSL